MALADEKYMLLTTFRRNGTPVATPVWLVPLAGTEVGFWTGSGSGSGSGKAKRLAHTPRVTVQPCDARGRVQRGTEPIEATARLISGPELATIQGKVKAKYGSMTALAKVFGQLSGLLRGKRVPYGDRGVVVTLPG